MPLRRSTAVWMLILEKNCPRLRIEVRPTALLRYHAHTHWTLTFDLDLGPWPSIPGELWSLPHTRKLKFKGQSVQKRVRVKTNGRTDRRTDRQTLPIALTSRLTRSVTSGSNTGANGRVLNADHTELDAQVPASCSRGPLWTLGRDRSTAGGRWPDPAQDVRLRWNRVHCCHRLPEPTRAYSPRHSSLSCRLKLIRCKSLCCPLRIYASKFHRVYMLPMVEVRSSSGGNVQYVLYFRFCGHVFT